MHLVPGPSAAMGYSVCCSPVRVLQPVFSRHNRKTSTPITHPVAQLLINWQGCAEERTAQCLSLAGHCISSLREINGEKSQCREREKSTNLLKDKSLSSFFYDLTGYLDSGTRSVGHPITHLAYARQGLLWMWCLNVGISEEQQLHQCIHYRTY